MHERPVTVRLEAHDGASSEADAILQEFSPFDRFRRAAFTMVGAIFVAAMLIPIPIVHLVGIPLMLLLGIVLSFRQAASTVRLRPLRIRCPKCSGVNRVGGGLGYRSLAEPLDRTCDQCRRIVRLTVRDR